MLSLKVPLTVIAVSQSELVLLNLCECVPKFVKSSCMAASFPILISVKLSRISYAIDERKYNLISLSFE